MKISLELTDEEASLIHTFIKKSSFDQYFRNMKTVFDKRKEAEDRAYQTMFCMNKIQYTIEDIWERIDNL